MCVFVILDQFMTPCVVVWFWLGWLGWGKGLAGSRVGISGGGTRQTEKLDFLLYVKSKIELQHYWKGTNLGHKCL